MIPHKLEALAFSFVMSFLMSGVMSATMLILESTTLSEAFVKWPNSWLIAMLVAFPFSLIVVPLTRRLMAITIKSSE
jgi:hypothetical protein